MSSTNPWLDPQALVLACGMLLGWLLTQAVLTLLPPFRSLGADTCDERKIRGLSQ